MTIQGCRAIKYSDNQDQSATKQALLALKHSTSKQSTLNHTPTQTEIDITFILICLDKHFQVEMQMMFILKFK